MSASQLNSIDIDVGGTFTDLVMNVDGHTVQAKVPTTPVRPLGLLLERD